MARTLQVDSHLHCSNHPSMPPSIISAASVLASLLLYYSAANECSADLEQMWTESLQFYSTYTLSEVSYSPYFLSSSFHRWFLYRILFYYAGGSYLATTLGGSWSSQVHRGSDEIQVQVRFCALFQLDGASPKMFALGLSTPA